MVVFVKMKHLSIAVIICLIAVLVLVFSDFGKNREIVYDCGMAEWHPDIPKKIKEECLRLRQQQISNEKLITT